MKTFFLFLVICLIVFAKHSKFIRSGLLYTMIQIQLIHVGYYIGIDNLGNVYSCGNKFTNATGSDLLVIKYNSTGEAAE
jgi:alpha-tubulin suppressor-like RCC1 family protein